MTKRTDKQKSCRWCEKPFQANGRSKFCSAKCARAFYLAQTGRSGRGLSASATRKLSELKVTAHLISAGYHVFAALFSGECDLIALKYAEELRVVVSTGYSSKSGRVSFHKKPTQAGNVYGVYIPARDEVRIIPAGKK